MASLIGQITGTQQRVQFIQKDTGSVIVLDACVQEQHSRESPPTEFEIEDGRTISDHIIVKPFALEIQGVISDTPLSVLNALLTTAAGVALPPAGIIVASGLTKANALYSAIADSQSPSQVAYKQLLDMQESRSPFDVITTLRRYENMFFKSISVPRDAATGRVLMFTVSLVQLLLVQPKTVNLKILKDPNLSAALVQQGKEEMIDPEFAQLARAGRIDGNAIFGVRQ